MILIRIAALAAHHAYVECPCPQAQPEGQRTPNVYMPNMKVRPIAIRAMRRKSRRLASDIFASPNGGQLARLLKRRERPRRRRTAEQCDERAPPHAEHRASSPSQNPAGRGPQQCTLSLLQKGRLVLGADLNCSESRR